jgi:beta-mannanase
VLFGLWENPAGANTITTEKALWTKRETYLGRKADIAHQFYAFTNTFPTARETWHVANGRTPLISWNGANSNEINAGRHDALIRTRARAVKALNAPVFLRYFWEPDAAAKRAMAVSPAAYIAQWKRVRSIFASEGATNAAFVWCPTAYAFKNGDAPKYYPGDGQVDWICADGYNWGQTQGGDKWRDWTTIYQSFYDFGTAHDKPMIAGEYGSVERRSGEKAQWFRTMRAQVKYMPRIKAIVYFDSLRQDDGVWRDWRVDTSADSYKAFRELARDPYFNTRNR